MPFAPFPTPDDILAAGRLSHIPLPLSGATLGDAAILATNKIVIQDYSYEVKYEADVLPTSASPAWTKEASEADVEEIVSGVLHIKTSDTTDYICYYRPDIVTSGNITVVEARVKLVTAYGDRPFALNISDGTRAVSAFIKLDRIVAHDDQEYLVDMTQYHTIRVVKNGTTDWNISVDDTVVLTGSTWTSISTNRILFGTADADYYSEAYIDYVYYTLDGASNVNLSGTATFRVTPAQLAQWKQLITYVKLNANNSATYTIKDTSGNTITGPTALSNGLNTIDISSLVSAELYKEIDVVVTLSRVSASDTSPELHYVAVLVEGQDELAWRKKSILTTTPTVTHYANTITDTTGAGYLTTIINGHTAAVNVSVQIDSGTIYKYTIPTGGYVVFGGYGRRFNSSLIVKADQTAVYVEGVLD